MHIHEDILDNLALGVIAVDRGMKVNFFNQSGEKIFGLSRSVVLNRDAAEVFKGSRIAEVLVCALNEARLFTDYEDEVRTRFSVNLPVLITTSVIFDGNGAITGASALIKDISGIKSIEEGALRKERLQYLGTFAANIAHEIRNPLSGIRGAAQLLKMKPANVSLEQYADVIIGETDRLNGIVSEMLGFARPARLNLKEINIHKVLDAVLMLASEGRKADAFIREYDPSLPDILGDESQLKQVFLNILRNSVESCGRTPRVRIITRMSSEFHVVEQGLSGAKMVAIEVIDNGCGIKKEDLEKVFTPFFTTKKKGSGLGLSISLKIVREHRGFLNIEAAPGRGTSVKIYLPAAM